MNYLNFIEFAKIIGKLKKVKRTGWVREGVNNPESVADHSFRTIVLAMVLAKEFNLNQEKIIKMAIIHDIGEAIIGDVVYERGTKINFDLRQSKEEKEKEAIKSIFEKIFENDEFQSLFSEMIERKTEETKFLWEIDKLERTIQALEYEKEQDIKLDEFFDSADEQIENPKLKELIRELRNLR